jgi:DNA-binding transcriptional ArsR family regulator
MSSGQGSAEAAPEEPDLWRALASPWRRRLLDLLAQGPATTGALAGQLPELSRFAVMQHLGVLSAAGVVTARRRGRDRVNYFNPVPLREWYEGWVQPLADADSARLLAVRREAEKQERIMADTIEQIRTVRLAYDLRIAAPAQRVFEVMTRQSLDWNPHTYGGDRVRRVVLEAMVGGRHYEDWGDAAGYLYGQVTVYDPPVRWATRGRLLTGVILDSEYELTEEPGAVRLQVTKIAVGPMTEEEAAGVTRHGDYRGYATAIEKLAAS